LINSLFGGEYSWEVEFVDSLVGAADIEDDRAKRPAAIVGRYLIFVDGTWLSKN